MDGHMGWGAGGSGSGSGAAEGDEESSGLTTMPVGFTFFWAGQFFFLIGARKIFRYRFIVTGPQ